MLPAPAGSRTLVTERQRPSTQAGPGEAYDAICGSRPAIVPDDDQRARPRRGLVAMARPGAGPERAPDPLLLGPPGPGPLEPARPARGRHHGRDLREPDQGQARRDLGLAAGRRGNDRAD